MQILPACLCGFLPEGSVLFICPEGEKLVKVRKMIGRIRKWCFRYKFYIVIGRVPHGLPTLCKFRLMNTMPEYIPCLNTVVKGLLAVTPSAACKEKSHCKVFFPVR